MITRSAITTRNVLAAASDSIRNEVAKEEKDAEGNWRVCVCHVYCVCVCMCVCRRMDACN